MHQRNSWYSLSKGLEGGAMDHQIKGYIRKYMNSLWILILLGEMHTVSKSYSSVWLSSTFRNERNSMMFPIEKWENWHSDCARIGKSSSDLYPGCCDKHHECVVAAHHWGLKAGTWRRNWSRDLGRALFIDFSQLYTRLSLFESWDGTTHCGTGPSTPISNWEMPTDMPTGQSDRDNYSLEVPSSWSQIDNQDWPVQWVRLAKCLVCTCRNKATNQRTPFCLGNRWMPCPRAQTEMCVLCSASPGKAHFCFLNRQRDIILFIKGWHKFSFKKNPELWKRKTHFYANPLLELQHLRKQAFRESVIVPHWIGFPT